MDKRAALKNVGQGFLGGLIALGYGKVGHLSNMDFDFAFMAAWRQWAPKDRGPTDFPRFSSLKTSTSVSEPHELLHRIARSDSPLKNYVEDLPATPYSLAPREFLDIWAHGATPDEWIDLASLFVQELQIMQER